MFDKYIQSSYPVWKTTGLSVAVVKDGKVIFKKGYGVADLRTNQPFTTSTISFCASTTKAMTAACIAMLVDEGKLKWDDKLKNILPEFRLYDAYVSDEITVRDLLRHNAGLGNGDLLWLFGYSSDEIMRRMRYMKPAYSFRSSFIYQNLMYVVAGEVIKKVSGLPWHEFISERIFQPLGMNHTYTLFKLSAAEPSRMTPHYMYDDSIVKPIEAIDFGGYDPAGSVVSCIDDITKWMQFLQDSAQINGQRLIKAETFTELFKPQSFVTPQEFYPTQAKTHPHWTTYGLGWFQQDYRGKMIQFHTGSLDGAIAIFGSVPEEKLSFYFFGNLDHSEIRHALMWKAIDLWSFNDNSRDWSTELYQHYKTLKEAGKKAEKDKEAKRVLNTKPSLPLESYTGKFTNETYGDAEIVLNIGVLTVKFPNNISLTLQHWNYDTFRGVYNYDWYGKAYVTYGLNEEGKVRQVDFDGVVYQKQ
ncbi:MAG: serine hydrolase [Sphingobacteriales bacterium]|nr:serine hydrolase [Sphingobacteriales bacterium]